MDSLVNGNTCPGDSSHQLETNAKECLFENESQSPLREEVCSAKGLLQCGECDFTTNNCGSLYMHIRSHTDDRPFKCQYCPYASQTESIITVHIKSHILDAPSSNVQHLTVAQPAEEPPIAQSSTVESVLQNKNVVVKEEIKAKEVSLASLPSSAATEKSLQASAKIEASPSKRFRCDYAGCTYSTNAAISYKNHLGIHSGEKSFQCRICLKSFRRANNRFSHEKLHVKKISQRCEHEIGAGCKKCKKHLKELLFRCLWCPFTCERESQLAIHCRSPHKFKSIHGKTLNETDDKPQLAPEIQMKREDFQEVLERKEIGNPQDVEFYFTNNFVTFPSKIEAPVTDALLYVQQSSFASEGNLAVEDAPSDPTDSLLPYGANEVSSFTTVSTTTPTVMPPKKKELSNDVSSRKFKCNHSGCTFSSTYSKNLILHRLIIHSKKATKKPFQCKLCPKSYARSSGLEIHERIHIHGYRYRCKKCDFGTNYSYTLNKHTNRKHGGIH